MSYFSETRSIWHNSFIAYTPRVIAAVAAITMLVIFLLSYFNILNTDISEKIIKISLITFTISALLSIIRDAIAANQNDGETSFCKEIKKTIQVIGAPIYYGMELAIQ